VKKRSKGKTFLEGVLAGALGSLLVNFFIMGTKK
jgi:hypothetical protein